MRGDLDWKATLADLATPRCLPYSFAFPRIASRSWMARMRIVALVASPDHVCARYRVAAFRSYLEDAGHQFSVQTLPRYWLTRWSLGRDAAQADVVVVQRRLLSAWQLRMLRRQARRQSSRLGHRLLGRTDAARRAGSLAGGPSQP